MKQVIKLGLIGAETTLPEESRIFVESGNILKVLEGESASGEEVTDFIGNKKTFSLVYTIVTEILKKLIEELYLLQISEPSFLNFIYTNHLGSEIETVVKMEAPVFGSVMAKDIYYHNGVNITLEEA